MIHRTRVSGWLVALMGTLSTLCGWWAGLLKGMMTQDPNAGMMAFLAMAQAGEWSILLLTLAWMGVTLNSTCPAAVMVARPQYDDLHQLNADTSVVWVDNKGFHWLFSQYSVMDWRAVLDVANREDGKIPYRAFAGTPVSRGKWDALHTQLPEAGLAKRIHGSQIWITEEGRATIQKWIRTPLLQQRTAVRA